MMSPWIFLERTRNRFWLLPTLIVVAIIAVFIVSLHFPADSSSGYWADLLLRSYSPEGARLILSSVATALMTVIGVLFSVTIVVLQQVSHQYSPRVIENFIKSFSSQIMLGIYVGTFIFCILLLRQVRGPSGSGEEDLPQLSISIALSLALACIGLLIHYVHHIAQSIKSTAIISSLRSETVDYLDRFASFLLSRALEADHREPESRRPHKERLHARFPGYFQSFFPKSIDRALQETRAALVRIRIQPGDFVQEGELMAEIESDTPLDASAPDRLYGAFEIGDSRTHAQDPRYGIRQLVDIALRALSPGINDPSTAIEAINSIGHIVCHLFRLPQMPDRIRLSPHTTVEIPRFSTDEILELAFNQILFSAKDHVPVLLKLDELLKTIETKIKDSQALDTCNRQKAMVKKSIEGSADSALYAKARAIIR